VSLRYEYWALPLRTRHPNPSLTNGAGAILGVTYLENRTWRRLAEFEELEEADRARRALTAAQIPPLPAPAPRRRFKGTPKFKRVEQQAVSSPPTPQAPHDAALTQQQVVRQYANLISQNPTAQAQFFDALKQTGWDVDDFLNHGGFTQQEIAEFRTKLAPEIEAPPQQPSDPKIPLQE